MTDDDTDRYNENVVQELNKLIVPYENYEYKDIENIDRNFVTSVDIERLLRNKFQKNSKVKKTDADIDAIVTTTTNLINKIFNSMQSHQSPK
jgi:hypothetical protein